MNNPVDHKQESYAWRMFKESLRLYFLPITGAIRAMKAEMIRSERRRKRLKD
ncbi:hypothetical protein GTP81_22775 [Rugamonas sp. FT107W]|uniref:Uncharacterized protein n=1 Tax=Duganella vulcania TaxID=2692166 RepID=A0A845HJQ0_9BURK|nr:hypothetical protein [Duganella vulcania]MYN19572.1 hypothetical protein [Duganella vulcania]